MRHKNLQSQALPYTASFRVCLQLDKNLRLVYQNVHISPLYSFHKCLLSSSCMLGTPLGLEDHRTEMLVRGELVSRRRAARRQGANKQVSSQAAQPLPRP